MQHQLSRRAVIGGAIGLSASIIFAGPASGQAGIWPDGKRGAVSITYDDGLDSQLDLAVPALDERGLRATFFVTMKNIEHRLAEWAMLPAAGHELGNHTMSHPCDLRRFTPRGFIEREVEPMEEWLNAVAPGRDNLAYAYPCDVTNLGPGSPTVQAHRYARLLQRAGISAARTSEGEPNNPTTLRQRAYRLQALAVGYNAPDLETVTSYLNLASRQGHWAILVFHEVCKGVLQTGDVAQSMHNRILDVIEASKLWVAPVGEVLSRSM